MTTPNIAYAANTACIQALDGLISDAGFTWQQIADMAAFIRRDMDTRMTPQLASAFAILADNLEALNNDTDAVILFSV